MVKREDLVDIGDSDYSQRQDEYVICLDCGISFGGTRGDYFMMNVDVAFTCDCGSRNLALVKNVTHQVIIKQ